MKESVSMFKYLAVSCFFAVLMSGAQALPAPMKPQKMMKKSDFVGTIQVTEVARVADDTTTYGSHDVAAYEAKATIEAVKKGAFKKGDEITLCWHDLPAGLIGGWSVDFKSGEKSKVFLKKDPKKACYTATYYHGKEILTEGE